MRGGSRQRFLELFSLRGVCPVQLTTFRPETSLSVLVGVLTGKRRAYLGTSRRLRRGTWSPVVAMRPKVLCEIWEGLEPSRDEPVLVFRRRGRPICRL